MSIVLDRPITVIVPELRDRDRGQDGPVRNAEQDWRRALRARQQAARAAVGDFTD